MAGASRGQQHGPQAKAICLAGQSIGFVLIILSCVGVGVLKGLSARMIASSPCSNVITWYIKILSS